MFDYIIKYITFLNSERSFIKKRKKLGQALSWTHSFTSSQMSGSAVFLKQMSIQGHLLPAAWVLLLLITFSGRCDVILSASSLLCVC